MTVYTKHGKTSSAKKKSSQKLKVDDRNTKKAIFMTIKYI